MLVQLRVSRKSVHRGGQLAQAQLPTTAPNPVEASLLAMNDNAILQKDRVAFIASKLSSHRGRIVYL